MYSVKLTTKAKNQLKKLDKHQRERIVGSLERIRVRPKAHLNNLIGNPNYSLRVGKFRLIIKVQEMKLVMLVLEIGHRKNIYKKLKK